MAHPLYPLSKFIHEMTEQEADYDETSITLDDGNIYQLKVKIDGNLHILRLKTDGDNQEPMVELHYGLDYRSFAAHARVSFLKDKAWREKTKHNEKKTRELLESFKIKAGERTKKPSDT